MTVPGQQDSAKRPGRFPIRGQRGARATATALVAAVAVTASVSPPSAEAEPRHAAMANSAAELVAASASSPAPTAPTAATAAAWPPQPGGQPSIEPAAVTLPVPPPAAQAMTAPWPAPAPAPAPPPPPATAVRHWYMVPTEANGCRLNVRAGPSTAQPVLLRLLSCDKGPWCWYQLNDCGRWEPPEVVGGEYRCRDGRGRIVVSDRWTVVAFTSTSKAFVASRCAWARQL